MRQADSYVPACAIAELLDAIVGIVVAIPGIHLERSDKFVDDIAALLREKFAAARADQAGAPDDAVLH